MTNPDHLAVWRRQYQEIHESMIKSREQFMAWSKEVAMIEGENHTPEVRRCAAEIKKDLQRYREVMRQLPSVDEFSDEEVEKMSGKASELLEVAGEVTNVHSRSTHIDRLYFILEQPSCVEAASSNLRKRGGSSASFGGISV